MAGMEGNGTPSNDIKWLKNSRVDNWLVALSAHNFLNECPMCPQLDVAVQTIVTSTRQLYNVANQTLAPNVK